MLEVSSGIVFRGRPLAIVTAVQGKEIEEPFIQSLKLQALTNGVSDASSPRDSTI